MSLFLLKLVHLNIIIITYHYFIIEIIVLLLLYCNKLHIHY